MKRLYDNKTERVEELESQVTAALAKVAELGTLVGELIAARARITELEALEADFRLWGLCRECGCKPRECQSARVKCCPDCTHAAKAELEKVR